MAGEEESAKLDGTESHPEETVQWDLQYFLEKLSWNNGCGATRGTAYHRVLELLPFARIRSKEDVAKYLQNLAMQERMGKESLKLIDGEVIWRFLQSGLGRRMRIAEEEGRLHREQQFVIGIPAREMEAGDSDELVVVQGIIDAYLEEGGQLILIDYKTDRIYNPRQLAEQYKTQLDYYSRALTQMT